MLKEEWRIHSTIFGSLHFLLFPVMIGAMAFMGSFLLPLIRSSLPPGNLSLIMHANYLMLGIMAGAFGIAGNEAMNRRFGQASLLAYASRILPVSDRYIFSVFVLKDTVYYVMLWVFPLILGFFLASGFVGIPVGVPLLLALTLTLSFLFGLCVIFLFSMIYNQNPVLLCIVLLLIAAGGALLLFMVPKNPGNFFPPLLLFYAFSWELLFLTGFGIVFLFLFSLLLFTPESNKRSRTYPDAFSLLRRKFFFFPYPALMVKDMIDLYRSGRVIGQAIFSLIIPLVVIWFFLSLTSRYLPEENLFLLFAIVTGVIASTMYTWLTSFDSMGSYFCLPISVRTIIMSKLSGFILLQLIPLIILLLLGILSNLVSYLGFALVLFVSVSFFSVALSIRLTGLSPDVLIYHVRVMILYFTGIGIATSVLSSLAFWDPWFSLSGLLLFIPAWILIDTGSRRWEGEEQQVY